MITSSESLRPLSVRDPIPYYWRSFHASKMHQYPVPGIIITMNWHYRRGDNFHGIFSSKRIKLSAVKLRYFHKQEEQLRKQL